MTQLQETENRTSPAATTWAAEFLLRPGESREILGRWMSSNAIHENKKRRATQVITGSFPCRKWLHKLYSTSASFANSAAGKKNRVGRKKKRVVSLWKQSPTSKVQATRRKSRVSPRRITIVGSFYCDRSWNMAMRTEISSSSEKIRTSNSPHCGETPKLNNEHLFPWTEVEEAARNIMSDEQEDDGREPEEGQADPYADVFFGKRRPDAVNPTLMTILDKKGKNIFVLEFKRTSDQRSDYRKRGEARAAKQHNVLVKSLQTVMRKRPLGTWNAKLVTFVGGTCGSVNAGA